MFKRSIKTDVLIFLSVLITASILVTAYIGINSTVTIGGNAAQITAGALRARLEETLTRLVVLTSEKNDLIFKNICSNASNLTAYIGNMLEHPDAFTKGNYWKFDDYVFRGAKGQYFNGKDDVSSVFIPNYVSITEKLKENMELYAYLDFIFPKVKENIPDSVAVWIVGSHEETRYYPNIGLGDIVPPDLKVTEEVFVAVANPKNNPQREVVWTPVYDDPAGQGLMITASSPIYTKEEGFAGVVGIDVTLNTIIKNIEEYKPVEDSYAFLIDEDGYSVAMPEQGYRDILARDQGAKELRANLNNISNEFGPVIDEMKEGSSGFRNVNTGNKELCIAYAPLKSSGFSLALVGDKAAVLRAVGKLESQVADSARGAIYFRILPIGLLILPGTLVLGFWFTKRTIEPVKKLTGAVREITNDRLDRRITIESRNEIGQLAESFNGMMENLHKTTTSISRLNTEIAERKKVQSQLAEKEEKYRLIFGSANDSIFLLKDDIFIDCNDKTLEMFGCTREQIINQPPYRFSPLKQPDGRDSITKALEKINAAFAGQPQKFEWVHTRYDGSEFYAEVTLNSFMLREQPHILAVVRDISERREAETALRESEERFNQIVSNAAEWVWEIDTQGVYTYSSPIVEELLGYKPQDIVGKKHFYDLFIADQRDKLKEMAFGAFAEKRSFKGFINVNVHKNGQKVWLMTSGVPVLDSDGNLNGYRGLDIDITDRKEAEEKIEKSRATLKMIIDSMPFGVMIIDKSRTIRLVNNKAIEMTGCSGSPEMVGKTCHRFVCPADRDNCPVLDKNQVIDKSERVLLAKDDRQIPIIKSVIPIIFDDEEVLLESFVDITERKEAEEKLNDLNNQLRSTVQQLEDTNKEMKNFVYIASHDLREPLRKVTSFGNMLAGSLKGKLSDDDAENFHFMIDGAQRMTEMIEGLLVYSRVSTQGKPLQDVNLNEIVTQLQQIELSVLIEEKQVAIEAQSLPTVKADPVQLRQLIQNLIANGIKYQKKDNPPHITITSKPAPDGMARIEVADNGIGIKPEHQDAVFAMFKRLHARSEYEGTGIGLAVCRKIVERHGGTIGVDSQPDKGSTFWFTIPVAEARVAAAETSGKKTG